MTATAVLILTGDELLRGFIQDANAAHIAEGLRRDGIEVGSIRLCGDSLEQIQQAVSASIAELGSVDLVILTGGLGPTHDDRTSEAVGLLTGRPLDLDDAALAAVEARLTAMGRLATEQDRLAFGAGNRKQATMARGSIVLDPAGTAPGYVVPADRVETATYVVLPGPPGEMRYAWAQVREVAPYRKLAQQDMERHERLVRIWGVPESYAARELEEAGHVDTLACDVTLCARDGELELSIRGSDSSQVDSLAGRLATSFQANTFAVDDERPVQCMIADLLLAQGVTLAVAESCTGGMLGAAFTDLAGSSAWFVGGAIVYSNQLKQRFAGVQESTLAEHGAVSEQVARELAQGIRGETGASVGVAITGIAGPTGGSDEKPVGTVYVAVADERGERVQHLRLFGGRQTVRTRSCMAAMHQLRMRLEDSERT